jgi:hypothetical protein
MGEPGIEQLIARLDRLEAERAIERLKYRYWRACDAKDPAAMRDCFTPDGASIDYGPGLGPFSDREELVEAFTRLASARDESGWLFHDMHHGGHPEIEIRDDGTATGRWTLSFLRVNRTRQVIERASMEYRDTYAITAGEWKIQTSHVTLLSAFSSPVPDGIRLAPGPSAS